MIHSPEVSGRDRLAAFFEAFALSTSLADPHDSDGATLSVIETGSRATHVALDLKDPGSRRTNTVLRVAVDFGGQANPLIGAMPPHFVVDLQDQPILSAIVSAMVTESKDKRCGRDVAITRLGEVLLLMVLRQAVERGDSRPGLLAGLSHQRLQRALVAMHDHPGRSWKMEDLAAACMMSRSAFMAAFPRVVGVTPAAYLQAWRLELGQRALLRGETVKTVARRLGFTTSAAFSRAYSRRFGHAPSNATGSRTVLHNP